VRDCIIWKDGQQLAFYQEEIMQKLVERKRVCVRGPHGLGKSASMALIILWFSLTRDGLDWKVITTASAWRQLTKFLWPEVHKWARALRWDVIGRDPFNTRTELMTLSLKLRTGEAFAVASDNPALIEGAHADYLLYVFDESKAILGETFDAAEGAFSGAGDDTEHQAMAIAVSTPGEPQGRFYDMQARKPGYEDWEIRHVTLEETIKAGRVSRQWADQRCKQWGETSAVFQNRVLGEFAASDEDGVIPLSWIEAAVERGKAWREAGRPGVMLRLGADIAGEGADKTVLAPYFEDADGGKHIDDLRYFAKRDTMENVGEIGGILTKHQNCKAVVDIIGMGAGVFHRLREQKYQAEPFTANESSANMDRLGELGFINKRSAGWWYLREMLQPDYGAVLSLPDDDQLVGDLSAPHYKVLSNAKIQVEPKMEIKARIHRSTDAGDGTMQAVFQETGSGNPWFEIASEYLAEKAAADAAQVVLAAERAAAESAA
jgi:hypothetical protein